MIRNQREYENTIRQIGDFKRQISAMSAHLNAQQLDAETIQLANAPSEALLQDLEYQVALYDTLRTGDLNSVPMYSTAERGKSLISMRIARGLTQRDLAAALGVSEAQISRDERNDYHGISQERYARILDTLGIVEVGLRFTWRKPVKPRRFYLSERWTMQEAGTTHAA
jgi:DNA-binding Xre family transcriptional regulator